MNAKRVLLEQVSPHGNLKAVVEEDGQAVHFYIWAGPGHYFGVRSVWVANLVPAPPVLDMEALKAGQPPLMPADACAHPQGMVVPKDLRVVWLEEGDGAALLDGHGILAIIPGWSGLQGFHGYARECTQKHMLAWPLGDATTNRLFGRVEKAARFWDRWLKAAPWPQFLENHVTSWANAMGATMTTAKTHTSDWPPGCVALGGVGERHVCATVGMSIRRQPRVEMAMEDCSGSVRAELAFLGPNRALVESLGDWLTAQAIQPWSMLTWLGDGHVLPCSLVPGFAAMLLWRNAPGAPVVALPSDEDAPVGVLWCIPVTAAEQALAVEQGAHALKDALLAHGVTALHAPDREAVAG